MHHIIIELNDPNEPILINDSSMDSFDMFFGNYTVEVSLFLN